VASSIKEFGFTNPVLIDEQGGIIAGHGRILAAKKLGLEEVPCIVLDGLTESQKKAYVIADNQLALNSGWDLDKLKLEIDTLGELDFDIDLLGFDSDFLDELLGVEDVEGLTDEDAVPEPPETPVSVLGDIWQLGNHRLMCGDSTSIDAVEKLMDGHKADMVFTDPPYNVAVKGKFTGAIKNDDLSDSDFQDLLDGVASIIYQFNKGSSYIAYEIKNHTQFEVAFSVVGEVEEIIVWNKDSASFYSDDKYNRKFEAILFIKGEGMLNCKAETNVWDYAKSSSFNSRDENGKRFNEKGNYLVAHPTTKPVGLVERALTNSSRKQDVIFDTFGGSGTTLIASEKLERHSRLMELDEKYVDVIINRWQDFTGKKAMHIESGKTYAELSVSKNIDID
jgi:DNA modification methylase